MMLWKGCGILSDAAEGEGDRMDRLLTDEDAHVHVLVVLIISCDME